MLLYDQTFHSTKFLMDPKILHIGQAALYSNPWASPHKQAVMSDKLSHFAMLIDLVILLNLVIGLLFVNILNWRIPILSLLSALYQMWKIRQAIICDTHKIMIGNPQGQIFFVMQQNLRNNAFFRDNVINAHHLMVKGQLDANRLETANILMHIFLVHTKTVKKTGW